MGWQNLDGFWVCTRNGLVLLCVVCCVVSCLAWRFTLFSRLIDVSLSRWASFWVPSRFIAGLPQNSPVCALPLPGLARPLVRDSATPRPLVPSVARLLTQLDTSVRWEDVPISSTGSSFNTHPFVLLLTLISPLSYGGRETVFEPFERSIMWSTLRRFQKGTVSHSCD